MTDEEHRRLSGLAGSYEILAGSQSVHTFARAAYRAVASELRKALAEFTAPPPVDEMRQELDAR